MTRVGFVKKTTNIATSVSDFALKNKSYFISKSHIHDINTPYSHNLHLAPTNLTLVQMEYSSLELRFVATYH
jgi:hypothetical protein